jgi:lactoylglutathione lyase
MAKSRYLGFRTNNQAEYEALIAALESAAALHAEEVICHLDSQLVVKQVTGEYHVKSPKLQTLWKKVQELLKNFKKTRFINVPRTNPQIQKADALVNETLDAQSQFSSQSTQNAISPQSSPKQQLHDTSAPSPQVKSMFVHTSIRTSNMNRSIDFYTRLLGLTLINRREIPQNNAEIAFLQDPQTKGSKLELTFYRDQKKFSQPEYENRVFDHLAFEVKNMNQTIKAMKKENVTITDEPFTLTATGSLIAFVEDPDGTLIELVERKTS